MKAGAGWRGVASGVNGLTQFHSSDFLLLVIWKGVFLETRCLSSLWSWRLTVNERINLRPVTLSARSQRRRVPCQPWSSRFSIALRGANGRAARSHQVTGTLAISRSLFFYFRFFTRAHIRSQDLVNEWKWSAAACNAFTDHQWVVDQRLKTWFIWEFWKCFFFLAEILIFVQMNLSTFSCHNTTRTMKTKKKCPDIKNSFWVNTASLSGNYVFDLKMTFNVLFHDYLRVCRAFQRLCVVLDFTQVSPWCC